MLLTTARQSGVLYGGIVGRKEFCIESPCGYVIRWVGYADNRRRMDVGYPHEG